MPTRRRFGPLILVASLTLLAAGCGGADDKGGTTSATSATPTTTAAAVASPLVGEWRRTQTCEEVLEILTTAGFNKQVVLESIAGNGFLPGVSSPDQIADPKHPCKGAVPQAHSHSSRLMVSSAPKMRRAIRWMTAPTRLSTTGPLSCPRSFPTSPSIIGSPERRSASIRWCRRVHRAALRRCGR